VAKRNGKRKRRKRKLTAAQKAEKKKRRKEFMTIFVGGKMKRVRREPTIDGIHVEEFLRQNADPIWLHQEGLWEYVEIEPPPEWMKLPDQPEAFEEASCPEQFEEPDWSEEPEDLKPADQVWPPVIFDEDDPNIPF
jgi:hypothetical protein